MSLFMNDSSLNEKFVIHFRIKVINEWKCKLCTKDFSKFYFYYEEIKANLSLFFKYLYYNN